MTKYRTLFKIVFPILAILLTLGALAATPLAGNEAFAQNDQAAANQEYDKKARATTYSVVFRDWQGAILTTQLISEHGNATAPAIPIRSGYQALGWDTSFIDIRSDLDVRPVYQPVSSGLNIVWFTDWDNTVIYSTLVEDGGYVVPPTHPDARLGYAFSGWSAPSSNIQNDTHIEANFAQLHDDESLVIFADWDGTILKSSYVTHGQAASAPDEPVREGYIFSGWSQAFYNNIQYPRYIIAQYTELEGPFTVRFVDWDNKVIKEQIVEAGEDAEAPTDPSRVGYKFVGWSGEFTNVTSNIEISALYEQLPTLTVTFKNWNGDVLKIELDVIQGENASAPNVPAREGYTFTGWDTTFTNVQRDLTVTAQFTIIPDESNDGLPIWAWILIVICALIIIGVILIFTVFRRGRF